MSASVETLPFPIIDFAKLLPHESRGVSLDEAVEERKRLWEAATGVGFWYLKSHPVYAPSLLPAPTTTSSTIPYTIPSDSVSSGTLPTPPEILTKLGTSFFDLPTEEKMKCWQGNSGGSRGYKPIGSTTVSLKTPGGIKDQCEMLNVGVGDVGLGTLGTEGGAGEGAGEGAGAFEFPDAVKERLGSLIEPFIRAHAMANEVLLAVLEEALVQHLGVNAQDVANEHPVLDAHKLSSERKNLSEMRIVKSPEDTSSQAKAQEEDEEEAVIAVGAHTDFGSLSCVHNFQPGLQVLLPASSEKVEWQDIPPIPGHAICNVGDALHLLSGGVLKSAMHRVVVPKVEVETNGTGNGQANGNGHLDAAKARGTRYSVVYFTRPHDDVLLRAAYGNGSKQDEEPVTAGEWFRRRQSKWRSKDHKEAWEQSRGTEHVRYAS